MLHQRKVYLVSLVCVACVGLAIFSSLPSRPGIAMALPPRSTVPPEGGAAHAQVGTIAVAAPDAPLTAWVGVQWLDPLGVWHDVESWSGEFKEGWAVRWVVEDDFGDGPFRWVIYERQGGQLWATSPSFYFPHYGGEWVWSTVATVTPTSTPTWIVPTRATPTITATSKPATQTPSRNRLQVMWR